LNDDLDSPADCRSQPSEPSPSAAPAPERRRLRASTLLNAGGVIAAAVTVVALEPKFPRFVGD
jgi:hypothetical protein